MKCLVKKLFVEYHQLTNDWSAVGVRSKQVLDLDMDNILESLVEHGVIEDTLGKKVVDTGLLRKDIVEGSWRKPLVIIQMPPFN